jgi:hypothetical protein
MPFATPVNLGCFCSFIDLLFFLVFGNLDLTNCCLNTTMEQFYKNVTGLYYLNNFKSLPISGVTLFELTVVNNWFIIMEGYALATKVSLWRENSNLKIAHFKKAGKFKF